jgi:hypothetical protein
LAGCVPCAPRANVVRGEISIARKANETRVVERQNCANAEGRLRMRVTG